MNEASSGGCGSGAIPANAAALGAADWLSLAAAPTFAIMALLSALPGGPSDTICSAAQGASLLSGMVPMYVLMSAFHATPWLKLCYSRRNHAQERRPQAASALSRVDGM